MPKRNLIWVVVVFAFFVLCVKADNPARQTQRDNYEEFERMAIILQHISDKYVHDVDKKALFEGAFRGMLAELDPYCTYIPPRLEADFERGVHGRFGGIGIRIGMRNGILSVISPLEGTPAFRAGVLSGDTIIKIEGESTEGITLNEAVHKLTGEPGTNVTITVLHLGQAEPEDITITRARIVVPTVAGYERQDDGAWAYLADEEARIGYVRLISFTKDTVVALDKAVAEMTKEDLRGLVVDLRFNPGGLLSSAVDVADRFLDEGVIVTTRGRHGQKLEQQTAKVAGTYPDFPVVLLVNRYSASAAEIMAGALQHHHRAVLVGERTFGKGSVQSVIDLGNGRGSLKMTTAAYYLPGGQSINRPEKAGRAVRSPAKKSKTDSTDEATWGVHPDIEVLFTDDDNRRLLTSRREADVIHAAAPDTQPAAEPAEPAEPAEADQGPFVDRQLERAVDLLKAYKVWEKRAGGRSIRGKTDRVRAETPAAVERTLDP